MVAVVIFFGDKHVQVPIYEFPLFISKHFFGSQIRGNDYLFWIHHYDPFRSSLEEQIENITIILKFFLQYELIKKVQILKLKLFHSNLWHSNFLFPVYRMIFIIIFKCLFCGIFFSKHFINRPDQQQLSRTQHIKDQWKWEIKCRKNGNKNQDAGG